MDETPKVKLTDKKLDDLTVGDAVKINLVVIAATVAIPVMIVGASAGYEAVRSRLKERKAKKDNVTVIKPVTEETE